MTSAAQAVAIQPPLTGFSQCHAGIVERLAALDRLPALEPSLPLARRIATDTLEFFRDVVRTHHAQEEKLLFAAMLLNARPGDERERVRAGVERLTVEHRRVEADFDAMVPALEAIAEGRPGGWDPLAVARIVADYREHARYEEEVMLPLAQTILGRDGAEMASLGLALHLRDPEMRSQLHFGRWA